MTDAVIVAAARTPIGRAMKGSLVDVDAFALARVAVGEAIARSGLPADDIDDLIVAESLQGGGVIARYVAVDMGLTSIPGLADNRHCAAGLSAVQLGAGSIRAGMDRVVVAGGTESLSSMPMGTKSIPASARDPQPWMSPSHPATPEAPAFDMALTVGENTARLAGLTRTDVDEWAALTHQRASDSIAKGWFEEEIVPVEVPDGDGTRLFTTDEHPRPDTTVETLANLKPLHPELDAPTVTAGNAAGLNDAAAAVVLTSGDYAAAHGLTPLARIRSWASVGVTPERTGLAPIDAIPKALERAGLALGDVDLFEVNEAFWSVPVATSRALGIDRAGRFLSRMWLLYDRRRDKNGAPASPADTVEAALALLSKGTAATTLGTDPAPSGRQAFPNPMGHTVGDFLVCAHGRRDACCGRDGTLLAAELAADPAIAQAGYRVGRTSHTGGHRFAPTAILLPEGTLWAFLDANTAARILRREGAASDVLPHYRGCTGLGSPGLQALERQAFAEVGWGWLDWARHGTDDGDGRVSLHATGPDGTGVTWEGVVASAPRPVPDCGKPLADARKEQPEPVVLGWRRTA